MHTALSVIKNNTGLKLPLTATSLLVLAMLPQVLLAESATFNNPLEIDTIQTLLIFVLALIRYVLTPIIIFLIVYSGFMYVISRGNEQQIQKATRSLLFTIIGGLIILGCFVVVTIVLNLMDSMR